MPPGAWLVPPEERSSIVVGSVVTDNHADGKAPFLDAVDRALSIQKEAISVRACTRDTDPVDLSRWSSLPYEFLALTLSCRSGPYSCGQCRGCEKRLVAVDG